MTNSHNGLGSKGRVTLVDALRGFSLLGILMANMLIFQYGMYGKEKLEYFNPSFWDQSFHQILRIFVEDSFMPIFTFLFGYSLIKMKDSLAAKGLKYRRYLIRRFLFLIAAGFMHSYLLWEGDILFAYGMIGFFLLLFINRKPKTLLIWGIVLISLMTVMIYGEDSATPAKEQSMDKYIEQTIHVNREGSYHEIMFHRNNVDPLGLSTSEALILVVLVPLVTAPMFLFGMAAAKKQRFSQPKAERALYAKRIIWILPAALILKAIGVLYTSNFSSSLIMLGGEMLGLGYIYLFAYVFSYFSSDSQPIRQFEAIGRMSMTNYLMQTVICTTIFYGYGLGLFGKVGVVAGIGFAIIIYLIQALISRLWLTKFRNGPIERLLRMWTYLSWRGITPSTSTFKVNADSREGNTDNRPFS